MQDVLLVVDVQTALVDALDSDRRTDFLTTLQRLIARAREKATPVVYVRHNDEFGLPPGSTGWQIAHEIEPRPGEPIVDKRFADAFRATDLVHVLDEREAGHLVVCGMQTEFCIDFTVREAERRGYRVTLVADGHATYAAGDASEAQIRAQVHRVLEDGVATLAPAAGLFAGA